MGEGKVGYFKRTALKHVYYLGWNRSPAQVGCMRQVLGPGALGRPRGIGWRGRWERGLGWGIHVYPWLIHVNVWQKPLQYCKVISLQLIKINEEKKPIKKIKAEINAKETNETIAKSTKLKAGSLRRLKKNRKTIRQTCQEKKLSLHFWLSWVFVTACGLSLVVASMGALQVWRMDFLLQGPWCRTQALGAWASAVVTQLGSSGAWRTCPGARGTVSDQVLNLCPLHWQVYS